MIEEYVKRNVWSGVVKCEVCGREEETYIMEGDGDLRELVGDSCGVCKCGGIDLVKSVGKVMKMMDWKEWLDWCREEK